MAGETVVEVDGRRLRMTNLDKVLYPQTGTTKADVARYYSEVAHVLLPHSAGRAVTRKRWVDGVGTARRPKDAFFSKALDAGTPSWVARADIAHTDRIGTYPVIDSPATLAWFAQIAALELHVPQWRFNAAGEPGNPDRLVLDLDPGPGVGLVEVAQVAQMVRPILEGMGLACYPLTSGSKGIHLYAPLDGSITSAQASELAKELARSLEADHPDLVLSKMARAARAGKVFLDWSQNNAKKTTIAPYSLRGTALPRVAAPRTWEELADPDLAQLGPDEVLALVGERGDPMAPLGVEVTVPDRLSRYRAMRDATRTTEPVPEQAVSPADAEPGRPPRFVIQEHHASRLHWDLRLERDGVLVSWALPKGVPTSPGRNHLAVPTEDHPLEYATFSGTIPAGQYGAGEMSIWDHGTYETEKWREGKEVIVTLTGAADGGMATSGPGQVSRFALIRTAGSSGGSNPQWLIILMKDQPGREDPPGGDHPVRHPTPAPQRRQAGKQTEAPPITPARPMLATAGTVADVDSAGWAGEMKWDGVRAIIHLTDGAVRVFGRSGLETTEQYPEVGEVTGLVHAGSAVLDGEIVALDSQGRPNFGLLQPRMQATGRQVDAAMRAQGVHVMVFDVVAMDGHDLTGVAYAKRRELLTELVSNGARIQVPPAFEADIDGALAASAEQGLEGVVAKRLDSLYRPGQRSSAWIKIRHSRTQEVLVVGWRPGKGGRAGALGSLLVAVPDPQAPDADRQWRYAGRVGTGFTARQAKQSLEDLRAIERSEAAISNIPAADARDAHWVTPTQVGEVEFANWTTDGRLRHPVWRGWRPDKSPEEIEIEHE